MVMVISTLLNPSLLIADEITSALDVSTQKAVAEMLVEFRQRGFVKSMIVITHDMSILYQIADSILVMYAGKLAEKAPTATIIEHARHPYTRALIASLLALRGASHEHCEHLLLMLAAEGFRVERQQASVAPLELR